MNVSESGSFADRLHPPMGGAAVEALPVVADQNRSLTPFTDGEIDGAGGAWHERATRISAGSGAFAEDC